ncbi:MAG: adenine deaminase [Clostridiales bacterium]|nr:adenine deaminase [Clostridiales bacterium]
MKRNIVIDAINGDIPFDLVIKNVKYVNVISREIYESEIGIIDGKIGHVNQVGEAPLDGIKVLDAKGKYAIPGLIDTHIHTESTMMTMANLAEAILVHGTTTIACDPHEIANVLGVDGVKYIIETSKNTPLMTYVLAPSCVPSTEGLETSGAVFTKKEIKQILDIDGVIGLGEVMDFPGVIHQSKRMVNIIEVAKEKNAFLQGHAPMLTGRPLSAYLSTGIKSCHETSFAEEARYKLRAGMTLECRESSIMHDIHVLAEVLKEFNYPENTTLCTDDREPDDLLKEGHLDHVIRVAIKEGIPAIEAIKMATYNAARLLKMDDIGALTPGSRANIVLLDSLDKLIVTDVFINGNHIVEQGILKQQIEKNKYPIEKINTVKIDTPPSIEDFRIKCSKDQATLNVMSYDKDTPIITKLETVNLKAEDGYISISDSDNLSILTVFERHGKNGNKATCLIKGLGLKMGAIATTVAHDAHNLVVVGRNEEDMLMAANTLQQSGGGIVCVLNGKIEALIKLPTAGLLSDKPVAILAEKTALLKQKMREFGIQSSCLLLQIATLSLPVIPEVRLTDRGLVDVNSQKFIPIIKE